MLSTGALLTLTLFLLAEPILTLFGATGETLRMSAEYVRVIALGAIFQLLATGFVPFIRNMNGSTFAMVAMILGFLTNVVLDFTFVWVLSLGMAGRLGNDHRSGGHDACRRGFLFSQTATRRIPDSEEPVFRVGRNIEGGSFPLRLDLFADDHFAFDEPFSASVRKRTGGRRLRLHRICDLDYLFAVAGCRRRLSAADQPVLR